MDLQLLVLLLKVELFLCASHSEAGSASLKPGDAEVNTVLQVSSTFYTIPEGNGTAPYLCLSMG